VQNFKGRRLISGFRPFSTLELHSFVNLRSVEWQFSTDVAGQRIDPEKSVSNCHSVLRKIPKKRRSLLQTA